MATTFTMGGIKVKVEDKELEAAIKDVVSGGEGKEKTYTLAALEQAAPGMMRGIRTELQMLSDRKVDPDRIKCVTVKKGTALAELERDPRPAHRGTQLGRV